MSSRPLDELVRDAAKVVSEGGTQLVITIAELRMLKDYTQVVGTGDKNVAWWGAPGGSGQGVYVVVRDEGK